MQFQPQPPGADDGPLRDHELASGGQRADPAVNESNATVILIGPYLSGKSTIRHLLAQELGVGQCSLNPFEDWELCERYYAQLGYDDSEAHRAMDTGGFDGLYSYEKRFQAHAVERCVADHPGHVIELGAAFLVYEDEGLLQRVRSALAPYLGVVLLLPSPDAEESYQVLRERYWALLDIDFNEHYIKHHSNHDLATHAVYTEGKTPEETRDEILAMLEASGKPVTDVILIGPPAAGKSTLSNLLASRLGLPQFALDEVDWENHAEAGYDEETARRVWEEQGLRGWYRYMQPVWARAMERILAEHRGHIIDFGAGHSVYEDEALFDEVRRAMSAYDHVILLLPSPDLDESVRILKERPRSTIAGIDANRHFIEHPSNRKLAKQVVYTEGKTPEETRDEVLRRLSPSAPRGT